MLGNCRSHDPMCTKKINKKKVLWRRGTNPSLQFPLTVLAPVFLFQSLLLAFLQARTTKNVKKMKKCDLFITNNYIDRQTAGDQTMQAVINHAKKADVPLTLFGGQQSEGTAVISHTDTHMKAN